MASRCTNCGTQVSDEEQMCCAGLCDGCWQDSLEQDDEDENEDSE